jgi:hypothetical protein
MGIVNDATRISSSAINIKEDKESSSPFVTSNNNPIGRNRERVPRPPRPPRELKNTKQINLRKERELIPNNEKVQLCLAFMANNMITRQLSGNIINRLKGKKSEVEYQTNLGIIDSKRTAVFNELNAILTSKGNEITSGYINPETFDEITDVLARIPLKAKNVNQKAKLKAKIITHMASQAIYVAHSDPLLVLKEKLMELSRDERIKVMTGIPL